LPFEKNRPLPDGLLAYHVHVLEEVACRHLAITLVHEVQVHPVAERVGITGNGLQAQRKPLGALDLGNPAAVAETQKFGELALGKPALVAR